MNARNRTLFGVTVALAALAAFGCGRDNLTNPALASTDPIVFDDAYGDAVTYEAFLDSKPDAVQIDYAVAFNGPASLRVTVPGPGEGDGTFAGGAFTTTNARDLSSYNAITFYVKSSVDATLNIAGVGNDNTGTSLYESSREAIPLTTDWVRVVVPIPNPSKLTDEDGLFFFAEGYENDMGYDFWMDEIKFEHLADITDPRPVMETKTQATLVGGVLGISGTFVTFDVGGEDILITNDPACFDYLSSNETVATAADGNIYAVGIGTATITGQVDTVAVEGAVTVNVGEGPEDPAPAPTVPAADVISLFSDVYADVPVDTWYAQWSVPPPPIGNVADYEVDGDNTKYYSNLTGSGYVGIVFASETIDATAAGMTHFHIDVWAPSGGVFYVKLVDFGPNGVYDQAGDDSEDELMFNGGTVPPFFSGQWSALEIPLSEFQLDAFEHLAQLIIRSTDVPMAVVDNVYFHK